MIVKGRNRKQRNAVFNAIRDGEFDSTPAKKRLHIFPFTICSPRLTHYAGKDKGKDLPPELLVLWENDRAKKAENKRRRALARQQAALDPFAVHKGGKKGRKDMLTALRRADTSPHVFSPDYDDSDSDVPLNPAPDLPTLVTQIRLYLSDISNRAPMALPPMDKVSRARVHEIADAFGLKSKGKEDAKVRVLLHRHSLCTLCAPLFCFAGPSVPASDGAFGPVQWVLARASFTCALPCYALPCPFAPCISGVLVAIGRRHDHAE